MELYEAFQREARRHGYPRPPTPSSKATNFHNVIRAVRNPILDFKYDFDKKLSGYTLEVVVQLSWAILVRFFLVWSLVSLLYFIFPYVLKVFRVVTPIYERTFIISLAIFSVMFYPAVAVAAAFSYGLIRLLLVALPFFLPLIAQGPARE